MPQHAALIAVLLLERPTCLGCVASMSRLTSADIARRLTTIATTLLVFRLENERCRVCGNVGPVYSVRRSDSTSHRYRMRAPRDGDNDLRPRARLFVNVQEIPTIQAGENTKQIPCGLLCGRPFVRDRPWFEIRFSSNSFWLDDECFAIWQAELERAKQRQL